MIKFVIINGLGGCGKSTFIKLCKDYCEDPDTYGISWKVEELSTVDFVKEIARLCGWKDTKRKKDREFLHDLKMAMENWDDIPNKKTLDNAYDILRKNLDCNHIFFVNIREAKGIESFSQLVMEHGLQKPTKVLIESKKDTNEVDSVIYEIKSVEYDKIYQNNGTLEELSEKAQEFVKGIIYGKY